MNQYRILYNKANYAIGIDPDLKKSGLAVWSKKLKKHTYIKSLESHKLIQNLSQIKPGEAVFFIDAGWLNGGFHHRVGFPDDFNKWPRKSQEAYLVECGVRVGENFGVGKFIYSFLLPVHGEDFVQLVRPVSQKWSAADLKRYTGWKGRTNEDSRDAARHCYDRL